MKHIVTNNITSISTDSENANYPATQMLDDHPKRVYMAESGVNEVTITALMNSGSSDIMLAGTNAQSADVSASDPNAIQWGGADVWGEGDIWANTPVVATGNVIQRSRSNSLWIEFDQVLTTPTEVTLELTANLGDTLEVGVMTSNISEEYQDTRVASVNPSHGMSEGRIDYSILAENSNGSRYYKQRDIVRTFNCSVLMSYDKGHTFMDDYDLSGQNPTGWKITDIANNNWVVFARIEGTPSITYGDYDLATITFTLTEVL